VAGRRYAFEMTACEAGVLAGASRLADAAAVLGVAVEWIASDGDRLAPGAPVLRARGDALQVARAEEQLLGLVAKPSGVASAAARLVALAAGRARVVCGAWKKVAAECRADLRAAIATGGAGVRIIDRPFVYLDKNYVRMLGGVVPAVRQARAVPGSTVVVQLRGESAAVEDEAEAAAAEGAEILVVDTGRLEDLAAAAARARAGRLAKGVLLGFGGGVTAASLEEVVETGAQIIDVGRAIIDAPLLDLRLDVR
jgi:nicotinate-nucleotide pyrophosphorylase (carboxylating)